MNPILNYERDVINYLTEAVKGTKWEDKDDVIENEIKRSQEDNESWYYEHDCHHTQYGEDGCDCDFLEDKYNPSRK